MSFAPLPDAALPEAFDTWLRAIDSGAEARQWKAQNYRQYNDPPSVWTDPPGIVMFQGNATGGYPFNCTVVGYRGVQGALEVHLFPVTGVAAPRRRIWQSGPQQWFEVPLSNMVETDRFAPSDPLTAFPQGMTVMRATAAANWADQGAGGLVVTWHMDGQGFQTFYRRDSDGSSFTRGWDGAAWRPFRPHGHFWDVHGPTARLLTGHPDIIGWDGGYRSPTPGGEGYDITAANDGHVYQTVMGSWLGTGSGIRNITQTRERRLSRPVGSVGRIVTVVDLRADGRVGVSFRGLAGPDRRTLAVVLVEGSRVELWGNTSADSGAGRTVFKQRPHPLPPALYQVDVRWHDGEVVALIDHVEVLAETLDPEDSALFTGDEAGLFHDENQYNSGSRFKGGYVIDGNPPQGRPGILRFRDSAGTVHTIDSPDAIGGGEAGQGAPQATYGDLEDRPPPDEDNTGTTYLAVDEDGGTPYLSTGETWLQLAKGVTA